MTSSRNSNPGRKNLRKNANVSAPGLNSSASFRRKKRNGFGPPVKDLKIWVRNESKNYANNLKTCLPRIAKIFAIGFKKGISG